MYQRIRDLREDRDLLQKDVAAYLKCTQVCYSNYETGKRDIPTEVLIQLAGLYHTSTDYILGLTDDSALPRCAPQGGCDDGLDDGLMGVLMDGIA